MTIRFACTACNAPVSAPDSKAGANTRCPKCGQPIQVPTAEPTQDQPFAINLTLPQPDASPPVVINPDALFAAPARERPPTPASPALGAHPPMPEPGAVPPLPIDFQRNAHPRRPPTFEPVWAPDAPKGISVLGIISVCFGGLGFLLSVIPCLNVLGLPFVGIGLLLGIIGIFVSYSGKQSGIGLPITGAAVSLVGLLISLAWIGLFAYFGNEANAKLAREANEIRQGPATPVAATQLLEQYNADELNADTRYKDKILEVSGKVARVICNGDLEKFTVELKAGDVDQIIDCNFNRDHETALTALRMGQQVTIRGKCTGRFLGDVTLEKCILK